MDITEATRAAVMVNGYIRRNISGVKLRMISSQKSVCVIKKLHEKEKVKYFIPTAEDLLATDWEVVQLDENQ